MEIKEAYCSFEVAKLLKEKGFDEPCCCYYFFGRLRKVNYYERNSEAKYLAEAEHCSVPTHQVACAWIRSKGYSIEIHATAYGWIWNICKTNGIDICNSDDKGPNPGGAWNDYDECTEAALKYALENLI